MQNLQNNPSPYTHDRHDNYQKSNQPQRANNQYYIYENSPQQMLTFQELSKT
jgi:hypothetical protein